MDYDRVPSNAVGVVMEPIGVNEQEYVLVVPPNPSAEELKSTIMNRKVEFNISKYVNEGWVFTKHNLCQFIGIGLIILLVSIAVNVAYMAAIGIKFWNTWEKQGEEEFYYDQYNYFFSSWKRILIFCAFAIARTLFFAWPILASMCKAVFIAMRNNTKIRFADFFSCFTCPYWFHLMGMGCIFLIANGISLVFWPFAIPTLYFSLTSIFAVPFHVEHYSFIGVFNSMYYSFKIFHRYFCSMLGFLLLLGVMQILGALCFLVGLFVTLPIAFVSLCYCFHHLVGVNGVAVLVPTSHLEGLPAEVAVPMQVMPAQPVQAMPVVPQVPVASAPSATLV